jgi:hypothetical protein
MIAQPTKVTYDEATTYCSSQVIQGQAGKIAMITNATDEQILLNLNLDYAAWLGATYVSPGVYQWNDKTSFASYTNWGAGEPNDAGGLERCLGIHVDGTWNDYICTTGNYIVCEYIF